MGLALIKRNAGNIETLLLNHLRWEQMQECVTTGNDPDQEQYVPVIIRREK
jgi:hypothetical protein